jgi:hypothetical protein
VPSNLYHSLAVTIHAIDPLRCLGENELVYPVFTNLTFETVGMIRVVACHDGLIEDRLLAHATAIRAICADRGTIREQE